MIFRTLREAGVLGMNARNSEIIARYNLRANYPNVDDKLRSKELAQKAGVAIPKLLTVLSDYGDIPRLRERLEGISDFALKPVKGAQGNGVLVIVRREGDRFIRSDGKALPLSALEHHAASILAGLYSLGGRVDRAMFEERLQVDETFAPISVGGVPDLRVIVFRGVPVMAMVRLPTRASRGRANLHQGAIAAGIDIATGTTSGGVHPDTSLSIEGRIVPHWNHLLALAARSADAFGLGYVGVDLVLDARYGPVLLEANARPGLSIQVVNGRGLWPRLQTIMAMNLDGTTPERRAEIARSLS